MVEGARIFHLEKMRHDFCLQVFEGVSYEGGISLRIVPQGTTWSKRGKLQKNEVSQGHERALKIQLAL